VIMEDVPEMDAHSPEELRKEMLMWGSDVMLGWIVSLCFWDVYKGVGNLLVGLAGFGVCVED